VVRTVPPSTGTLGKRDQLLVGSLAPEACRLADVDPAHTGTAASSVSMKELTEKTAFPGPAGP